MNAIRNSLRRVRSIVCGVLLMLFGTIDGQAQSPQRLVSIEPGELPIILTAPHGGREPIVGVEERKGNGIGLFKNRSDAFTAQLTEKLADGLKEKLGKRPYLVIARFHRKYVDANRPRRLAYESDAARPVYDTYHNAIAAARQDIIDRWGRGVLFDIHGQGTEPQVIFRGTQNGKTTTHLRTRFGHEAVQGGTSFFGRLAEHGFQVNPVIGSTDAEHDAYAGGYTVTNFGSGAGGSFDAIQLELGRQLRSPDVNSDTANRLAGAIAAFAKDYLPTIKPVPPDKANATSANQKVRVGVYADKGTGRSLKDVLSSLVEFRNLSVTKLKANDIRSGSLAAIDVLIQPGGSGGGQGRHLGKDGRTAIRKFVREGGGYIGICGGAYLASADYEWSLNILDAKVVDRKHWRRGHGMVEIGITDVGQTLLKTKEPQLTIQYWQGPLLAPANRPDIEDYEVVATFNTEIAENGAPKGVMRGTTAIATGTFGSGRVVCFSPHPELTEGLKHLIKHAIDHVQQKKSRLVE